MLDTQSCANNNPNSYASQIPHQLEHGNIQSQQSQDSQDIFMEHGDGRQETKALKRGGHTVITYIANNNYDQQYFERLANFLESFLKKSHDDWLLKWVPTFASVLVKKATQNWF